MKVPFYPQAIRLLMGLSFWAFVAVKITGSAFAAWSWWWVLVPVVPVLGLDVQRLGL